MADEIWWSLSEKSLGKELSLDLENGLKSEEIKKRQDKFGKNLLPKKKKLSPWKIFLRQFTSLMVILLLAAALIAGILGELIDTVAILSIVFINAVLGFIQEYKAEKSLEALQKMVNPSSKVIRDGKVTEVLSKELVVGDLLLLEQGDLVPADARILELSQFSINESALTGESLPIQKNSAVIHEDKVPIAERKNMVFRGTSVLSGKAKAVVTSVGSKTELGKIAESLHEQKKEETPLQNRLNRLGKNLIFFCAGIILIIFIVGLIKGNPIFDMILISISLAVAAIPEGLPAIITVSLAIGVKKMAKKNALTRRLHSVETLGCSTVICTDKTGTLTQNKIKVKKISMNDKEFEVADDIIYKNQKINIDNYNDLKWHITIGILCNNSEIQSEEKIIGDPTEGAILIVGKKAGLLKHDLEQKYPILDELPFDSERKKMSILRKAENENILFVKGAPDELIKNSISIYQDNEIHPLADSERNRLLDINSSLASQGLRIIATAYKKNFPKETLTHEDEKNLIFAGFFAMIDPPRLEVNDAILECQNAKIRIIMITGDHKDTATAIAKQLNLIKDNQKAITGAEIDEMNDEQLKEKIDQISVIARASAHHKLRIIKALKSHNHTVAMTGDGVNDALAIKAADIGISMGITGTEVTKEASDMIILDDNFASIESAIKEGRGIFANIQKFIGYLFSANIAEILVIFLGMVLAFKDLQGNTFVILTPIQILWLNLITDGMPALAMSADKTNEEVMKKAPRKTSAPILSISYLIELFVISILVTIGVLLACFIGIKQGAEHAQTMAFTVLVILELLVAQIVRYRFKAKLLTNFWFLGAILSSLAIHLCVIYIPIFHHIFKVTPLSITDWKVIAFITGAFTLANYLFFSAWNFFFKSKAA